MSQVQPYSYRELDRSKKEIRVLYVFNLDQLLFVAKTINENPEVQSDPERVRFIEESFPIRCEIKHCSLEDKPKYVALSYTWGDATRKRRLVIEDGDQEFELQITENLDSVLRHINIDGCFWIDAVCINQADEVEKSWQVQQMWTIYKNATYMASWLGLARDDSDLVIKQIAEVALLRGREMEKKSPPEQIHIIRNWTPPDDFLSLPAFSALTKRPYWRRVWVQQELQASENVWFHCGTKKISLSLVRMVLGFLHRMLAKLRREDLGAIPRDSFAAYLGTLKNSEDMRIASAAMMRHRSSGTTSAIPLAALLKSVYVIGEGLQASDPRDHILGLLNMTADSAILGISPDYSKSKEQIFIKVAIALIQQIGLKALSWSNFQESPETGGRPLPSWVPDWSIPILRPLGELDRETDFRYRASGDSVSHFKFLEDIGEHPKLVISGVLVDTVRTTGQVMMQFPLGDLDWYDNDQDPNMGLPLQWLSDIQNLSVHCGDIYGGLQATEAAIWRTPIADMEFTPERKHQRASENMQKGYQLCLTGLLRATMKSTELHRRNDDIVIAARYWRSLVTRCSYRRLFVTERGYLGLGPAAVSTGDIIAVFLGLDTPFVLRGTSNNFYQTFGEAYVHGIMDGEMMKNNPSVREFKIC